MRALSVASVPLLITFSALAQPSLPRDPMSKDGLFTICAFQMFDQCDLLTEQSIQKFNFSAAEKRILHDLRRHAAAPSTKLEELEKSFGKSSAVRPDKGRPNAKTVAWFNNSRASTNRKAKCPECGIYIYLTDDVLTGISYMVDDKFSLAWNRVDALIPR